MTFLRWIGAAAASILMFGASATSAQEAGMPPELQLAAVLEGSRATTLRTSAGRRGLAGRVQERRLSGEAQGTSY